MVILGALLPVFMGALDNTILASVLPTIAREFGDHSGPLADGDHGGGQHQRLGMSYVIGHVARYRLAPMAGLCVSIGAVLGLAWQAERLKFWVFEALLTAMGVGFGGIPAITAVALQNTVKPHQLGTAISTMTFSRGLLATMTVALFGVIVLAGGVAEPGRVVAASAADFAGVFLAAAASLAIALICLVLLEENPLRAGVAEAAG